MTEADETILIERAVAGDAAALASLFDRHRARLRRLVRLRLDRRLQGRVDPSDVLQDAFVDAAAGLAAWRARLDDLPFFLWLRLVAAQRLIRLHRHHLGAAMRDAGREVALVRGPSPRASCESLAEFLLGRSASPSRAAHRAEV